jgi:hypothetical protein
MSISREQCVALARLVLEDSGGEYSERRLADLADYADRLGTLPELSAEQRSRLAVVLRPVRETTEAA